MTLNNPLKYRSILLLFGLSSQALMAMTQPDTPSSQLFPNVITLSAGAAWETGGETQTFYLNPGVEKTYDASKTTKAVVDVELFLGKQWLLRNDLQSQLGFAVATTSNALLSGNIWDDANPQFNNYHYSYKIQHTHFAIKGKLIKDYGYVISPWISASLGVGFNQTQSYSSSPTIYEAIDTPDFQDNTQTAFTYTLSAGIQTPITQKWLAGIGYEFADWGKSQLSRSPGQTMNNGLTLNHLYTNNLMLNLTYNS